MPISLRQRRTQGQMAAEVRRMLRETVTAESYWTDQDILDAMNRCIDFRTLEMAEEHEGWFVAQLVTDIVANQREYEMPTNAGRPRRIGLRFTSGSSVTEFDLWRDDRLGADYSTGSGPFYGYGVRPTVRTVGNLLLLEPPPTMAQAQGLLVETEVAPPRLVDANSTIPDPFPDLFENLLVHDCFDDLVGIEDAQGNVNEQARGRIQIRHQALVKAWRNYTPLRMDARVLGRAFSMGD